MKPGDAAGTVSKQGYLRIKVLGVNHAAHRLAWAFSHGVWPSHQIDHKNGDRLDNRIVNLRDVPPLANSQNRALANSRNTTRLLGVSRSREKFTACITVPALGKIHLGTFSTPSEAHEAYVSAKAIWHDGAILQRLRADTFSPHHVAAAHSRDCLSVRTGPAQRERSGGRWVSFHVVSPSTKNFGRRATFNQRQVS